MALKKLAGKKPAGNNKRGPKAKQVVEEKPKVESEEDSDAEEEQNMDDDSNSEAEGVPELDLEAAESDDEDESENDDDEDSEDDEPEPGEVATIKAAKKSKDVKNKKVEEDEDAQEDSDEEPIEAPIAKKDNQKVSKAESSQKGGIPKVAVARIPVDTPKEQQLFVTNLPKEFKHLELVALFAKFGRIAVVNRIKSKAGGNHVMIAFESADAVDAALAAKEKALTLDGQVLTVARPLHKDEMNKRTVAVGLIGPKTTKEQVTEHFKGCGAIDAINFSRNAMMPTAYVRFQLENSIPKALKLNGSELNSRTITVREEWNKCLKTPECTLALANTGKYESFNFDTLEKILKKHGDIQDLDIVCTNTTLAFVTYKTKDQAEKALKQLNGKTIGDLELKLEPYHYSSSQRTILVSNLAPGVDEQQLNKLFSDVGVVENVKMMAHKALVKFTTEDAFCKSFLQNERVVNGRPIFLEPNSFLKLKMFREKSAQNKPFVHRGQHAAGGSPAGGPGKFQGPRFNNNNNNKNQFNKKPFNKRPAQENGSTPNFKRAKN